MYALIDGHNFYVSCERLFRPALNGIPVIVLSNNDGCAIARSQEAKNLGIKMGMPWFQIKREFPNADILALSANFPLYGDLSNRMMSVAAGLGPEQEIYSIDESFIGLHGVKGDLTARANAVRQRITKWVGIPCGVGIGTTKTLAKIANHISKTADRKPGSYPAELAHVCNLAALPASDFDAVLEATELGEIWGIGRRIGEQLQAAGLRTALDVARMDPGTVRRWWSVVLERTVREMQGVACIDLESAPAPRKEIACTRSFGAPVTDLEQLVAAVTAFATRAGQKLRAQEQVASSLMVFARTSPFRRDEPQYARSTIVPLRRPTSDTAYLVQAAVSGLRSIYCEGFNYAKAGVHLLELHSAEIVQGELDLDDETPNRPQLMKAIDTLNDRFGQGTVGLASAGVSGTKKDWAMRQHLLTPQYTTRFADIPVAVS